MKKSFLLICLSLFVTCVGRSTSQVETSQTSKKWLQDRYEEATSVKVGMSREDLLKVFDQDGGLDTIPARRYTLRSCSMIKIDVEFDTQYGVRYAKKPDPELKITNVSKPYLEYASLD